MKTTIALFFTFALAFCLAQNLLVEDVTNSLPVEARSLPVLGRWVGPGGQEVIAFDEGAGETALYVNTGAGFRKEISNRSLPKGALRFIFKNNEVYNKVVDIKMSRKGVIFNAFCATNDLYTCYGYHFDLVTRKLTPLPSDGDTVTAAILIGNDPNQKQEYTGVINIKGQPSGSLYGWATDPEGSYLVVGMGFRHPTLPRAVMHGGYYQYDMSSGKLVMLLAPGFLPVPAIVVNNPATPDRLGRLWFVRVPDGRYQELVRFDPATRATEVLLRSGEKFPGENATTLELLRNEGSGDFELRVGVDFKKIKIAVWPESGQPYAVFSTDLYGSEVIAPYDHTNRVGASLATTRSVPTKSLWSLTPEENKVLLKNGDLVYGEPVTNLMFPSVSHGIVGIVDYDGKKNRLLRIKLATVQPNTPKINAGGVVTAGQFVSKAGSPGQIMSIFGADFTNGCEGVSATLPLPTLLCGVEVKLGGISLPLFYAGRQQINVQFPFEIGVPGKYQLSVYRDGIPSNEVEVSTLLSSPDVFEYRLEDVSYALGVVTDEAGRLVTTKNPLKPGRATIWCSGLGLTSPSPNKGESVQAAARTVGEVRVKTGFAGNLIPGTVEYSGLTPGYVGLYQVNVLIPENVPRPGLGTLPILEVVVETDHGSTSFRTLITPVQ